MSVIGVDIGGTFTDFVVADEKTGRLHLYKVPSTPRDPSEAFLSGTDLAATRGVPAAALARVVHGTTVATNTVIQRNGAKTGLITTRGFRDVLEIGRSNRPHDRIYGLQWVRPKPLVERYLRLGVRERIDARGSVVDPLDEEQLRSALAFLDGHGVEAVAIAFLHAWVNPVHERRALELAREQFPHLHVSISSAILPQWREYERTNTTAADAFIKPVMDRYLGNLERGLAERGYARDLLIMKSNGGIMQSATARAWPIETFLSGPAAAVVAAARIGQRAGMPNLIEIDMGGTSFDVALVEDGAYRYTTDAEIEPTLPVKVAMIDIRTIGAGGGSIAWLDEGGALKVGPRSAGADPGPACYGRGGTEPTTTDANVVLGRIDPAHFLGGEFPLRPELAAQAIGQLAARLGLEPVALAQGILDITVAKMAQEVRAMCAARGLDPRDFVLLAGGGAGPLHAVAIARELGMRQVLVPRFPGLLSATGLLLSDLRFDAVRTFPCLVERDGVERIAANLREMVAAGLARIEGEGFETEPRVLASVDMRYERQAWEIEVPVELASLTPDALRAAYDREHHRLFGFSMPHEHHEVINLKVTVAGTISDADALLDRLAPDFPDRHARPRTTRRVYDDASRAFVDTPAYERDELAIGQTIQGPAIIDEPDSTTWIPGDASCRLDAQGNLLVELDG